MYNSGYIIFNIWHRSLEMIIAFIGGIGSGKTISMVKYMHEKYKQGRHIFTNFKLNFTGPKNVTMLDINFFKDYQKSGFNVINSIVAIDEAHVFIDSRPLGPAYYSAGPRGLF